MIFFPRSIVNLTTYRRGMASFMGKDTKKIKTKGGGKWKYMSENEMQEISAKFSPYKLVVP